MKGAPWSFVRGCKQSSSPGLWVVSEDIEKGVDASFELPGSKNVREMGNVAFPPVGEKTSSIRPKQLHDNDLPWQDQKQL